MTLRRLREPGATEEMRRVEGCGVTEPVVDLDDHSHEGSEKLLEL